ncbi:MAG: CoA transferase, partial [Ilumatobacteraceae bacterium]
MAKVGPLDGIRVVELTNWMAGPSAAAALADMGADVIKIEPLTGDTARKMSRPVRLQPDGAEIDAGFTMDNRGKRSVAVSIDKPEGADLVRRLVARADILLCNLLPQRQTKFGLDPETLFKVRPGLVHATLTGYGLKGPDSWRPGFDVTAFFGRAAITESLTDVGAQAPQPRPAQGDHTTALALLSAILAALRVAEKTGEGQIVDVSLMGAATWTMATDLAPVLVDGREPSKRDRDHRLAALATSHRCSDDRFIILNMTEPRWWPRVCERLEHPEWVEDERFVTPRARLQNMPELTRLLDAAFITNTLAEWGRLFDESGLIWGPAQTLGELAVDPQTIAAGLFPEVETTEGPIRTVALPMHIDGAEIRPRGPAPAIGQHTLEVLRQAGVPDEEIF